MCWHSLGGALATLGANWIKAQYKVPVKLYTFGSPRVGHNPFAIQSETSLNGIYRAVHRSDPVPMVPVWPFVHAGNEYRISTCVSLTGAAHKMAEMRLGISILHHVILIIRAWKRALYLT